MSSERIAELEAKMREIRGELNELTDARDASAAAALVGRTFRYRNCYSCPEDDADYWWLYTRILSSDEHGSLSILNFQTDKNGRAEIEITLGVACSFGYRDEIGADEFNEALAAFNKLVSDRCQQHAAAPKDRP